ncbi:MAG: ribonuclease J [Deltaproteobacteria bacterium]|nr:ribonuclease J [Candidatus Anaeroferrophillus wilburensis]MBN2888908.1 ribonuclease J [Deltaproteobacteria bacterium]
MAQPSPEVRLIPLGGMGEIGMNMMAIECDDEILVIDCGLMFPEPYMLGVDLVIPDTTYLKENRQRIKGIIITHGHEDHIGALPFVLPDLQVPVYGTPFTLGLIKNKLKEFSLHESTRFVTVKPGESLVTNHFIVEFIRVIHSIPDGVALHITTEAGNIIHTGDFKIDSTPLGSDHTDLAEFARRGENGVKLLLSDSTNVEQEGFSAPERRVKEAMAALFPTCPGRIIISLFSSNLLRIHELINLAHRQQRKVALYGRSLLNNVMVARELGYLVIPDNTLIDIQETGAYNPEQLLLITTGSQGEPFSGLSLLAAGGNKWLQVIPGDTIIFSSRFIPGNEKAINNLINRLYRRGARVLYKPIAFTHTSGHAHRDELRLLLNLVKPENFIPIHGEYRHLVQHAQLAKEQGITADHIVIAGDGDIISLDQDGIRCTGTVETGKILIDGKGVGEVKDVILHDRKHLSRDGVALVVIAINESTGDVVYGPDITTKGLIFEDEKEEILAQALAVVTETLANIPAAERTDWIELKTTVRTSLKRFFKRNLQRSPIILPVIIEL